MVSVREDNSYFYRHGKYGLEPIIKERKLRLEREVFYTDNGAIILSWTSAITPESFTGRAVGHILMIPEESFEVYTEFGFWIAEQILKRRPIAEGEQTS